MVFKIVSFLRLYVHIKKELDRQIDNRVKQIQLDSKTVNVRQIKSSQIDTQPERVGQIDKVRQTDIVTIDIEVYKKDIIRQKERGRQTDRKLNLDTQIELY